MNKTTWQRVKLGEIAESIVSGGTPLTSKSEYYNGAIPWLNTKEVKNNRIYFTEKTITEFGLANSSAKWIEKDSVIVAMYGATAGKVAINKIPLTTNQACCNITLDANKADYNFIYYTLLNSFEKLEQMTSGAAQQNLNVGLISNFSFSLPPLETQQRIAEILSSLDDKIDLFHRQNKTLESLSLTLFRHTFIDNPKRNEWEEKPLSEIADFLNGLACQKLPPQNEINRLPVLKIKELREGITESSDWATSEVDSKYIVQNGDVIFAWSASLMVKVWAGKKCVLNQHLFKVSSKEYPKWFYYFWCLYHLQEFISIALAQATTMGHIKRTDLDNAICSIPPKDFLDSVDKQISPIFEKIQGNSKQIQNLESLRDIMLPKLLSGEMEV